ncbi:hypothetical protein C3E77_02830 [Mycetocola zhujimingii]|nr:hypothetical protein C3E77_02830 [Mycetocola zhujimingii]
MATIRRVQQQTELKGNESMSSARSIRRRAPFAGTAFAAMVGGLVLAAPLSATAAPSVATFTVAVSDATVQVGETVDVTVSVTGAVDVYAYELALGFDPAVLEYVDGSAQTPVSGVGAATVEGSELQYVHTKLGTSPSATGDLTLATLSFEAIDAGEVTLALDAELVGADAVSLVVTDAASAVVEVLAPPAPAAPPSAAPAAPVTPGGPAGEDADPVSGPGRDILSGTGADLAAWPFVGAGAALLLGALLVFGVRRKRASQV